MRVGIWIVTGIATLSVIAWFNTPTRRYVALIKSDMVLADQQKQTVTIDQRLTLIKRSLTNLLSLNPSFSRVRVALIHTGISSEGSSVLQWDIIGTVTAAGHAPGTTSTDMPLSQWKEYLGTLIAKKCAYVLVDNVSDEISKLRMTKIGIAAFLSCPIFNKSGELLGAIFASWDDLDEIPVNQDLAKKSLTTEAALLGRTIRIGE